MSFIMALFVLVKNVFIFLAFLPRETLLLKSGDATIVTWKGGSGQRNSHNCEENIRLKSADCEHRGLTDVPPNLYPEIKSLDLRNNNIRIVNENSFAPYSKLIHLYLSSNKNLVIQNGAFSALKNLETLELKDNNLVHGLPNVGELPKCKNNQQVIISMEVNGITRLDSKFSIPACPKGILDLYGNNLKIVNPATIASLKIAKLIIGKSFMTIHDFQDLMSGVSKSIIDEMKIMGNRHLLPLNLTQIDPFIQMKNKSLTDLFFYEVPMILQPRAFSSLQRVSTLKLQGCGLRELRPEYFDGMIGLQLLQISDTNLQYLNPDNATWTINIHTLYLITTQIEVFQSSMVRGLNNLSIFAFGHSIFFPTLNIDIDKANQMKELQVLIIQNVRTVFINELNTPNLITLAIKDIQYKVLNKIPFDNARSVKYINMSSAKLSNEDLYKSEGISLFHGLQYLKQLILNGNELDSVPTIIYQNLSSLQDLQLRQCKIKSFSPDAFEGLLSLKTLDLQNNQIQFLPAKLLSDTKMLENLMLDNNQISFFDSNLFRGQTHLLSLSFSCNQLANLNHTTFQPLRETLTTIDMSKNPLVCNCDTKWLTDWMANNSSVSFLHPDLIFCSSVSLKPLRGKLFSDFKPDQFCHPDIALYSLISVTVLTVIIVSIITYFNRWALRYKLFLLKLAIVGYNEMEDAREHGDFDYDINIMFADGDEPWAMGVLRPALQEELPNFGRIAFGDYALTLGMDYFEAIIEIVETSYKNVLLVSRAGVLDHMFISKFRIARNHVTDTQIENLVLVFLENIPDQELPHLVRLFLSDHGNYIRWEEDEDGQEFFWKKFYKCLRVNRIKNNMIPPE